MADIGAGKQIVKMSAEEVAESLASLYRNFNNNRKQIQSKIDDFIVRTRNRKVMEVHTETYGYKVMHPDITYFREGYALINEIRVILGLEEVDYKIGILNEIEGTAYQINANLEEFQTLVRKRGDKSGLAKSQQVITNLLELHKMDEDFDITDKFISFLNILEKKTAKYKDNLNYGYAFEAFGHFNFKDGSFKETRHQTYYNYYKASRKNIAAWTTGGDVNNTQYKLIRIYRNDKGRKQISSASITSSNTIVTELENLKQLLNSEELTPQEIALKLSNDFTQLGLDSQLDESIQKVVNEVFKEFLS